MTQPKPQIEASTPSAQDEMATLVHDLGNYIQIAISAVRIMSRHADVLVSDGLGTIVSHAAESLERAGALVRLSSGTIDTADEDDISIGACLTQMGPMLRYACGSAIRIKLLVGLLPNVRCSRLAFQNTVLNLALNARDAMPLGGTLTISAFLADGPETSEVEVTVDDTGTGMTPDILARAFEPHFTTRRAGAGHGMGLPGVKAFAERAGGRVFIRSTQSTGTSVVLRLPASTPVVAF